MFSRAMLNTLGCNYSVDKGSQSVLYNPTLVCDIEYIKNESATQSGIKSIST